MDQSYESEYKSENSQSEVYSRKQSELVLKNVTVHDYYNELIEDK